VCPLIGVGILWQQGYFRQMLDGAGRQHEVFPFNDPATLPIQPVLTAEGEPLHVAIALPGRSLRLRVWEARSVASVSTCWMPTIP
jgi:glycogen phosphorylase